MQIVTSCVSAEFGAYRRKLANHLGGLMDKPFEVRTQEDFQEGGQTLLEALADHISDCDVVIHVVGDLAGPSKQTVTGPSASPWLRPPTLGVECFLTCFGVPLPRYSRP